MDSTSAVGAAGATSVSASTSTTFSTGTSVSGDLYQLFTYYYAPSATGQVLTITFTGPGAESVVAPEPSTIVGPGICALMFAGLAWRRGRGK